MVQSHKLGTLVTERNRIRWFSTLAVGTSFFSAGNI